MDQALLLGISSQQLWRWKRAGRLEWVTKRVLVFPGSPATDEQEAMVAVLDAGPGAVLSHTSALALWNVPGFQLRPLHVLQPRGGIRRVGTKAKLHTSRNLPPHHIKVLGGIPVTSPTRTLFDVAPRMGPAQLGSIVDKVWSRRLTSGSLLHSMYAEIERPGLQLASMKAVLAARGPDYMPPESNVERRYNSLIEDDGQPPLRRQANAFGEEGWLGRLDYVDDLAMAVFLIDGDAFHRSLIDAAADARQDEALRAAGYDVTRFPEHRVWYDGPAVAAETFERRQAGRLLHGAPPITRQRRLRTA